MIKLILIALTFLFAFSVSHESYAQEPDEAACLKQLQQNKHDKDAFNCIVKIYVKQKRIDELIILTKDISESEPGDADIHYKLALLYASKNENEKAIAQYGKAIELKPGHARALLGMGRSYLKTGKTTEGRKSLEAALNIDSNLEEARLLLHNTVTQEAAIPNSVQGRRNEQIKRVISGRLVKPGDEEWQKTCSQHENIPFPVDDKPSAENVSSLTNCSSYELYYGINQKSDPVKARLCAFDEVDKQREDGPFSGNAMLMTIYANGIGAKRNLPLAIKLACKVGGAPAEIEYRITHLERLREQSWQGTDFSLCDDITSGLMQGYCAAHSEDFSKIKRNKELLEIQSKWSQAEIDSFASLRKAADKYFDSHPESEVDQSGTARTAMTIEERAALEKEFLEILTKLEQRKLKKFYRDKFVEANARLDILYMKTQSNRQQEWGTVTKDGIKTTQRDWLKYRDAWVTFCKVKYPDTDVDSLRTLLTLLRVELLKSIL